MRINKKISIIAALLLTVIIVIIVGWSAVSYRFSVAAGSDAVIYIPTASSYEAVLDSIESSGTLIDPSKFKRFAQSHELDRRFRPGRYQIKKGATYAGIIRRISGGMQSPVRVTFNNIRTIDRLAATLARSLEPDSLTFLSAFTNDSIIEAHGFDQATFIGMFIPNTYEFYWNTTPKKFIERMDREYKKFWSEERMTKLSDTGLTRDQAITLASIVYEETKMSDEMPRVAGVYINRLGKGMPLQADPTVKFAMGDFTLRRVLTKHLSYDSPYNTYANTGLPPGAICMPSIKAIDAVLNYERHKYIYFCARADFSGYHNFAINLADHNRNANAYTSALNKLKIYN